MLQKIMEKLNKKQLRERISSAILSIALIVSISGVIGCMHVNRILSIIPVIRNNQSVLRSYRFYNTLSEHACSDHRQIRN